MLNSRIKTFVDRRFKELLETELFKNAVLSLVKEQVDNTKKPVEMPPKNNFEDVTKKEHRAALKLTTGVIKADTKIKK